MDNQQQCPVGDKVKCVLVLLLAALVFAWFGMPKYEIVSVALGESAMVYKYNRITGETVRVDSCELTTDDEEEFWVLDERHKANNMTDAEWGRYDDLKDRRNSPCWFPVKADSGSAVPKEDKK